MEIDIAGTKMTALMELCTKSAIRKSLASTKILGECAEALVLDTTQVRIHVEWDLIVADHGLFNAPNA